MKRTRARSPRLFVSHPLDGESVDLNDRESHYLRHVLRLRSGEPVVVFNGLGAERNAVIDTLAKEGSRLRVTGSAEPLPESPLEISLLQGLAKSDAMDLIIQKSAELGVRSILPVKTDFSVVKLQGRRETGRIEHWKKVAQGACEQSGRHTPPVVHAPEKLETALDRCPPEGIRLVLHPESSRTFSSVSASTNGVARVHLLVGPEGGLNHGELELAERAGFVPVSLGPRILRVETATMTACAIAQALWGDLG